ncbi:MAG: hypothetical protein KIS78_08765 [Labilithrix sp.]|nr:hypothetical protein [Labilithrix sp.]MCW5832489.1 hypothetical protein [Labilithrix sp.]
MTFRRLGAFALLGALVSSALPACSATANVGDVWMSIDEDGARRRNVFFTDSAAITCVAEVGIGRQDVTLEMFIRQIRGTTPGSEDFESMDRVVLARDFRPDVTKDRPALVTLTLVPTSVDEEGRLKEDEEAPFAPGSYICEVMLDGELQKSAAFNIDYPPCPTAVILAGTPCLGFYTFDKECPASGATGQREPTCICSGKDWVCP